MLANVAELLLVFEKEGAELSFCEANIAVFLVAFV